MIAAPLFLSCGCGALAPLNSRFSAVFRIGDAPVCADCFAVAAEGRRLKQPATQHDEHVLSFAAHGEMFAYRAWRRHGGRSKW